MPCCCDRAWPRCRNPSGRLRRDGAGGAGERAPAHSAVSLHDEIGQTLTVALLMLKRAVDQGARRDPGELANTQDAVRAGLDEVRSIARRLRPEALEDLGSAQCPERIGQRVLPCDRAPCRQTHCLATGSASTRRGVGLLPGRAGELDEHREARIGQQGVARLARRGRPTHAAHRRRRHAAASSRRAPGSTECGSARCW